MIIPVNTDSTAGTPLISLLDLAARTEALDQQVIGVRPPALSPADGGIDGGIVAGRQFIVHRT